MVDHAFERPSKLLAGSQVSQPQPPCSHVDQLGKRIHQLSPETPATCPTGQTTIGFAAVPSANVSGPRSLCSPHLARDDSTSQKLAGATLRDAQRLGQFFVAKTVRALREE